MEVEYSKCGNFALKVDFDFDLTGGSEGCTTGPSDTWEAPSEQDVSLVSVEVTRTDSLGGESEGSIEDISESDLEAMNEAMGSFEPEDEPEYEPDYEPDDCWFCGLTF